jgi:ornithine cyclodeaminase/alanine dehydrogenase
MLILRNSDLTELLSIAVARDAILAMLHEQATGTIEIPPRVTVDAHGGSWLRLMPAIHNASAMMGFKSMNVAPGVGMRSFIGLIDLNGGDMLALLDADYITTLRTGATTAIATELFAPSEIESMALIGSGAIAAGILRAIATVRAIPRVDVYSPNAERRTAFARRMSAQLGIDVRPADSARAAVRAANLVCGAYRAPAEPAVVLADLRASVHINSLSSVRTDAREVATGVWRACSWVVLDHRSGVAQSGDGQRILRDHPFDLERASELWETVRNGSHRTTDDGRTMYKSVGAASQDVALAMVAYRLARERGAGESIAGFPELRALR